MHNLLRAGREWVVRADDDTTAWGVTNRPHGTRRGPAGQSPSDRHAVVAQRPARRRVDHGMTPFAEHAMSPARTPGTVRSPKRRFAAAGAALVAVVASLAAAPSRRRPGRRIRPVTVSPSPCATRAMGRTGRTRCGAGRAAAATPTPTGPARPYSGRRGGEDAFAPQPRDAVCTMQYGGPATARITGTWAGRPVDATYDRTNGCAIARWDRMVPLLPEPGRTVGAQGA